MKKAISISVDNEKYNALLMYSKPKNVDVNTELNKSFEQLYQKMVPQTVREYIDMVSKQAPSPTPSGRAGRTVTVTSNETEQE